MMNCAIIDSSKPENIIDFPIYHICCMIPYILLRRFE